MTGLRYLDDFLDENNFDAFVMADNSSNSNMYYLTGFEASDSFVYLRKDGKSVILVPHLEVSRAKDEADVDKVLSSSEYLQGDFRGEDKELEAVAGFLEDFEVSKLAVPEDFSLAFAEKLRDRNFSVDPVQDKIMDVRKVKDTEELNKLRTSQKHTEEAMRKVEDMIQESEVRNGELYLEDEVLTSERVRRSIKEFLREKGCEIPEEPIVASGLDSADPHKTGSGPIKQGESVVVDIFPRHQKYFGDMTRTFVKGEVDEDINQMYDTVLEALEEALKVLEQGEVVKSSQVHGKVCDVLEDHGYKTLRDGSIESGFTHSTGHGVGLDLHESPRIGDNNEELKEGNVITVEPGLYIKNLGGLRIEEMILVKEDGYENFNSMHRDIQIK